MKGDLDDDIHYLKMVMYFITMTQHKENIINFFRQIEGTSNNSKGRFLRILLL